MSNQPLRSRVIKLYKTLQYLGRDYPGGAELFRQRCHDAFMKNSKETEPLKIKKLVLQGEFYVKELEALYAVRKYRAMKNRYYNDDATPQN